MSDTFQIEFNLDRPVTAEVSLAEVIFAINDMPILKKWNEVAGILNKIDLAGDLNQGQKALVARFLKSKLAELENPNE